MSYHSANLKLLLSQLEKLLEFAKQNDYMLAIGYLIAKCGQLEKEIRNLEQEQNPVHWEHKGELPEMRLEE